MGSQLWEVVGGGDKGGIIVRAGPETTSDLEEARLSTGALVEEVALQGDRLHYRLISGTGPFTGWVSTKLKASKDLVVRWVKFDGSQSVKAEGPIWLSRLGFKRVANFRDAAGADADQPPMRCTGGRLRRGLLFRTGQWTSALREDMARIRDELGVKTYIDLRNGSDSEGGAGLAYDDYPPCPSGRHDDMPPRAAGERRRVHCPFLKGLSLFELSPKVRKLEKAGKISPEDRWGTCAVWLKQMMSVESYWSDLILSLCCHMRAALLMNSDEVLKAMKVLADPANYPVAFGCMAGKDRTGILGQLVLSSLGASLDDIVADYLATNDSSAHINACIQVCVAMWHAELKEKKPKQYEQRKKHGQIPEPDAEPITDPDSEVSVQQDPQIVTSDELLASSRVYGEIARFIFHVLDHELGGTANYLASIGFGADDLESLRSILVEPDADPDPDNDS